MEIRPVSIIRNLAILAAVPWGTETAQSQGPTVVSSCNSGACGCPAPLGASFHATMGTQIQNGIAARMVLYHFDFCPGEGVLTPRGRRQLFKIAQRLPRVAAPILIQPTGDNDLDEARRACVLDELSALSFSVPEEQVQTAFRTVRALEGPDAMVIDRKLQRLSPIAQPNPSGSFPPPNSAPNR